MFSYFSPGTGASGKGHLCAATMFSVEAAWRDGGRGARLWGSLSTSWLCRQWGAGGAAVQQQHPACTEDSMRRCHRWMTEKPAFGFVVICTVIVPRCAQASPRSSHLHPSSPHWEKSPRLPFCSQLLCGPPCSISPREGRCWPRLWLRGSARLGSVSPSPAAPAGLPQPFSSPAAASIDGFLHQCHENSVLGGAH